MHLIDSLTGRVSILVAYDRNRAIGHGNKLPWHLPADLKRFKALTMGHHIVMGRKTYESIGRPLAGRANVVITREIGYRAEGSIVVDTLERALDVAQEDKEIFIIGGAQIFLQMLPFCDRLYATEIDAAFDADTYFPEFDKESWVESSRDHHEADPTHPYPFDFVIYDHTKTAFTGGAQ